MNKKAGSTGLIVVGFLFIIGALLAYFLFFNSTSALFETGMRMSCNVELKNVILQNVNIDSVICSNVGDCTILPFVINTPGMFSADEGKIIMKKDTKTLASMKYKVDECVDPSGLLCPKYAFNVNGCMKKESTFIDILLVDNGGYVISTQNVVVNP